MYKINYVDVDNSIFSDCQNKIISFDNPIIKLSLIKYNLKFYRVNVNKKKAYFINENNFLFSYDLENTNVTWKIELNAQVKSIPQILNNQIFLIVMM